MSKMFKNCESLFYLDVSIFNTENVLDMSDFFQNCKILEKPYRDNIFDNNVVSVAGIQ